MINTRLIEGILRYKESENIPGFMLFVDFEKTVDKLEWSFIEKYFSYFNFAPELISWIKILDKDIQICLSNNGWTSEFFSLERGVRQDCPSLHIYIFILCTEILANAIRKDPKIRGIKIDGTECKINQYADDTTLFLDGSKTTLEASVTLLER